MNFDSKELSEILLNIRKIHKVLNKDKINTIRNKIFENKKIKHEKIG